MTIPFTQGKLEEQERQAILEEVYTQAKAAARAAVKALGSPGIYPPTISQSI